ncbi:MAG: hypothetical protein ACI31R_02415 [Bacilli bacterium]
MKKLFRDSTKSSFDEADLTEISIDKVESKRKVITISLIVILLMLCIGISFAL